MAASALAVLHGDASAEQRVLDEGAMPSEERWYDKVQLSIPLSEANRMAIRITLALDPPFRCHWCSSCLQSCGSALDHLKNSHGVPHKELRGEVIYSRGKRDIQALAQKNYEPTKKRKTMDTAVEETMDTAVEDREGGPIKPSDFFLDQWVLVGAQAAFQSEAQGGPVPLNGETPSAYDLGNAGTQSMWDCRVCSLPQVLCPCVFRDLSDYRPNPLGDALIL